MQTLQAAVQFKRFPCGCYLEWNDKRLELVVCESHRKEHDNRKFSLTRHDLNGNYPFGEGIP
jgi:hypothetical protein